MDERAVGESDLAFHKRRVMELEAEQTKAAASNPSRELHEAFLRGVERLAQEAKTQVVLKPPGERSGIKLTGRGDGLTTGIHDALTGEDLGARYGVRKIDLKITGDDWSGASLVLELGCPVTAELTGCWPSGNFS